MSAGVGEVLARIAAALEAAGIPYMVAGSFASGVHGMPRTTRDLDLVIDPDRDRLRAFLATLDDTRYDVDRDAALDALARRSQFNVIDIETGWKIDLVIRKIRAFSREELARRQRIELDGVPTYVASPEDTIVAKLEWAKQGGGSERQLRDCADIVGVQGDALDRAYIERWVAELGLDREWAQVKDG
jgi:hypothetical protein